MYKVFKGYVPTRDKKCLVRFKNRRSQDLYSLEDVEKMPEYAGILADETVLIDVDDFDESEILFHIVQDKKLKCRVYETTRGKHFLFQNSALETCKTHTRLACGLNADIKLGCRNSYSILKFKGKNRKILYDTDDYYQPVSTDYDEIRNGICANVLYCHFRICSPWIGTDRNGRLLFIYY